MAKKMDQVQTVLLHSIMSKRCIKTDDGAVYLDGWTDEKVLEEANEADTTSRGFTIHQVSSLRRAFFGNLPKGEGDGDSRIGGLLTRIEALEAWAKSRGYKPRSVPPMGEEQ